MDYCEQDMCDITPLTIGKKAPNFEAPVYQNGELHNKIELSDYKGKWVVLFFYPLDFTFVCPTELIEMGELYEEFQATNCEVIAASVDSVHAHKAWAKADERIGNLPYPIISDLTKMISYQYGILHEDGVSLRGAFIIDPDGVVQSSMINNLNVGRNANEILRLVKAFQTGDLCQASFKKGDKSLGKA